jgi:NADPH:quinone reductase-like Zn-dependent oxidoreductase
MLVLTLRDTKKATECTTIISCLRSLTSSVAWASRASDDEAGQQQFALIGTAPNVISKLPDNITYDEAATLPVGLNTAQVALYDKDGLGLPHPFKGGENFGKGKSILVLGGSAVVGQIGK